jgi:hypothetical protein
MTGHTRRDAGLRTESFLKPVSPVFLDDVSSPCHEGKILVVGRCHIAVTRVRRTAYQSIAGKRQDFRALSGVIQIGGGPIPSIPTPTGNTLQVPIVFSASGGVGMLTA